MTEFLFWTGTVLLVLGIIMLFGQPKKDGRTRTGIEKGKTSSIGTSLIFIVLGIGCLYLESTLNNEYTSNVNLESNSSSKENSQDTNLIRDGNY